MAFIQIIEMTGADVDQMRARRDEWKAATEGARTTQRSILAQDRNDPNRYLIVVFFDSYESAMANSQLPATQQFAEAMSAMVDSVAFTDLDVIEDLTL